MENEYCHERDINCEYFYNGECQWNQCPLLISRPSKQKPIAKASFSNCQNDASTCTCIDHADSFAKGFAAAKAQAVEAIKLALRKYCPYADECLNPYEITAVIEAIEVKHVKE